MTPEQLQAATGCTFAAASKYAAHLTAAMAKYGIKTVNQVAGFIGNLAVESGKFALTVENLNYQAPRLCAVWPARFPTLALAQQFAGKPEALANRVYANRMGNGGPETGDGFKFRGRGLLQTTGREAYTRYAKASGKDCVTNPDLLLEAANAADVAAWSWQVLGCNALADAQNWSGLTKKINGGMTGYAERVAAIQRCLKTFAA